MGVIELGGGARLPQQPGTRGRILAGGNRQQLERYVAIELLVVRTEHDPHAAGTEFLEQPVVAELRADQWVRLQHGAMVVPAPAGNKAADACRRDALSVVDQAPADRPVLRLHLFAEADGAADVAEVAQAERSIVEKPRRPGAGLLAAHEEMREEAVSAPHAPHDHGFFRHRTRHLVHHAPTRGKNDTARSRRGFSGDRGRQEGEGRPAGEKRRYDRDTTEAMPGGAILSTIRAVGS